MSTTLITPTLSQLFWVYFVVGATGFGGSMVWLRRIYVEERRWLSAEDFNDALSLSQFLPGPMVFNFIVVLGRRFYGVRGIVTAAVAVMIMPFIFALVIGTLYARYGNLEAVQNVLRGIGPVAAGLLMSMAFKMASTPSLRSPLAVFAVVTFTAVTTFRFSLPLVLLVVAPLSILYAAKTMR